MASLKQAKMIDQETKDLIFGYVRKANDSLSSTIPVMINYICLLYYYLVPEKFIKCSSECMQIASSENDGRTNDIVRMKDGCGWSNMHGNVIINPTENPKVTAAWRVKIDADLCVIGIHSMYGDDTTCYGDAYTANIDEETGNMTQTRMSPNYGWQGDLKTIISHINKKRGMDEFKRGDMIEMRLDLSEKTLRFQKNNKETNIVFNNIDISANYHLMIRTTADSESSFQIIDFDIKHCNSLSFHSE